MDQPSHVVQSYPPQSQHEPGKIFVGGLSWETTQEKLRGHFEAFGEISDCVIMQDPVTKRPRGFGFVTFKDQTSVTTVLAGGPHVLDGKTVDPKPATVKAATGGGGSGGGGSQAAVKKIFVGGIANGTTEDDVRAYFSQFGTVTDLDLKYDKATQRMRGFGFVGFESEDVVEKLCQTHFHQINGKTVEVKKAEPRYATTNAQGFSGRQGGYQPYGNSVRGGYGGGGGGYGNMASYTGSSYGYGTPQQQQEYGGAYSGYNYPAQGSQYGAGYEYSSYYNRYPTQQQASGSEQGRSDSSYYQQQQQPQQYQDFSGARTSYGSSESYGQQATSYPGYDSTGGYTATAYTNPQSSGGYGRGQQQPQQQQQQRAGTYNTYNR